MAATDAFLSPVAPAIRKEYEALLAPPQSSRPAWVIGQGRLLTAIDRYILQEQALPPTFEIGSHEAGGQCRIWFPHYLVRGDPAILGAMEAIFHARRSWALEHLFHGYPACDEVHHEPETFLFFQIPLLHLTGDREVLASVEDLAHHVGNWVPEVPEWYDWARHGFRSTWLGTRVVRDYPPYDYQEANHFRFVAVALAAYRAAGNELYLNLAHDYAGRWCDHIEALATEGRPIECSILPRGLGRREMGNVVPTAAASSAGVYPVFYATVATNTACEVASTLLDLYRISGLRRHLDAAGAMIAQFYEHANEEGRPASQLANGAWGSPEAENRSDPLEVALRGQNHLLVNTTEKYRAVAGDTRFDAPVLRWAEGVDESKRLSDQLQMALMTAAHRLTGEAGYLERACAMALRGMAATEGNRRWHQCSGSTRYGFRSLVASIYDAMLAGVDYATRGGLPMVGLSHEVDGRPGLPAAVALRSWEPTPTTLDLEAVNTGPAAARWKIRDTGSRGHLESLKVPRGEARVEPDGGGWSIAVPGEASAVLEGAWGNA